MPSEQPRHPSLLTEAELSQWLGFSRRAALEKWLREHGIPIIYGKQGRVCTTLEAINQAIIERDHGRNIEF